ncbi:MAG TPA: hypothetical protein VNW92_02570, partial [Polyangiaceae bacterium]|nr:hypothetical protein [Polyangiaceae bacterium]
SGDSQGSTAGSGAASTGGSATTAGGLGGAGGSSGNTGGSLGSAGASGSGGASNGGGLGSNTGSGGGPAATGGAAGASPETPTYHGSVQFGWLGSGAFDTIVDASFTNPAVAGMSCTKQAIGACTVSTCTGTDAKPAPQAGAITVSDGNKFNISLTPGADGSYTSYSHGGVQLPGGQTVTVTAAGGDVPAFTGAVTEPLTLLVTSPLAVDTGTFNWPRTQDLTFVFDRGVAGVQLVVQGTTGLGKSIGCTFPSEPGTATVPAAVLGELDAGNLLQAFTFVTKRVQAGQYSVDLISFGSATNVAKTQGVNVLMQ